MVDVRLNVVSRRLLAGMSTAEKIRFILDEVKQDKILVLEAGLDAGEQFALIHRAMAEIEPDGFTGIEIDSHTEPPSTGGFFQRLARRWKPSGRMTIVAPADALRTLRRSHATLDALVAGPRGSA